MSKDNESDNVTKAGAVEKAVKEQMGLHRYISYIQMAAVSTLLAIPLIGTIFAFILTVALLFSWLFFDNKLKVIHSVEIIVIPAEGADGGSK